MGEYMNNHPEYRVWRGMIARCTIKSHKSWRHYGERGIVVCERWLDFWNFLSDMGKRPTPKHEIDRIDNDGNYEPGNCRWATRKEQMLNSRNTLMVLLDGERVTSIEAQKRLGIHEATLWARIHRGEIQRVQRCRPAPTKRRTLGLATHCRNGHEFTAENTAIQSGTRHCRTCKQTRRRSPEYLMKAQNRERLRPTRPQMAALQEENTRLAARLATAVEALRRIDDDASFDTGRELGAVAREALAAISATGGKETK